MKKLMILSVACATFMLAACGGSSNKNNSSSESSSQQPAASTEAPTSTTTENNAQESNTIALTGNDQMKFNKTEFTVKAGQKITLSMKNIGKLPAKAMSHDVVVLKQGSSYKDFGMAATKAQELEKLPSKFKDMIITHTKMLGPGESDTITFTLDKPGVYPFLCSFPGHYVTMNGTITVE